MKLVFERSDLVKFGNYIMSDERRERFENINKEFPDAQSANERLKQVHHADIENYIDAEMFPETTARKKLVYEDNEIEVYKIKEPNE